MSGPDPGESLQVECERLRARVVELEARVAACGKEQAAVREGAERFRAIFEHGLFAMGVADEEGRLLQCNPAFENLMGYTQEELLRLTFMDLTLPEDVPASKSLFRRLVGGEIDHFEVEKRYLRKDGSLLWCHTGVAAVRDASGRLLRTISTIADITQRVELEIQLARSQRLEAVGRLAGGVAHDFNNLLTVILGQADMALATLSPQDPLASALQGILDAGLRAAQLTDQLLAFSRRKLTNPRIMDINELLQGAEKLLRRLLPESIVLTLNLAPRLRTVRVDPAQLEQVIFNLAVNARDAMPDGGALTLRTADRQVDARFARNHPPMTPGAYVLISVADTGCGMDEETQRHIFDPFFTTRSESGGTGLGLATVYGIVKQSLGFVWVESRVGRGSTFDVYLPGLDAPPEPVRSSEAPERANGGTGTVLLVEDDPGVRGVLKAYLGESGYNVLEADGPGSALLIAESYEKPIDLLLTDVVMPHLSGPQLATRLSGLRPGMAVLFVTGHVEDERVRESILQAGGHYLRKPFSRTELNRKVRELLR